MSKDLKHEPINLYHLQGLLAYISADLPREDWVRHLMAAKAEFGEDAKAIIQEWSATAASFNVGAFNATWKSLKSSGGVTIASLVLEAKKNGFKFAPISREDEKRLNQERKQREAKRLEDEAKEQALKLLNYKKSKQRAQEIFSRLSTSSMDRMNPMEGAHLHPYYFKKGLSEQARTLGKAYLSGNALVIPVYKFDDFGGLEVVSLQFIEPDGAKRFLKGGELKGGFVPVRLGGNIIEVVICEGYATGLTLAYHYAPMSEVICAFNAGNLKTVARAFKKRYPMARIIIAADNDRETAQKTGVNIGITKATEAAAAVDGALFIPEFDDHEQGSDWNDRYLLDKPLDQQGGAYE